jgi:VIT1/CCC1 family predicted Fe2+/Mn2+ transporter
MNTVAKIGFVLLLSGPIYFIIPYLMTHDDTTWAIVLLLWTIGLVSVILGIVLVIAGLLMKPKTDDEAVMH